MKRVNTILAMFLLVVMAGCGGNKQSSDELIVVDVTKSYPKKELILQDFMDVEYIALETNDEFLNQGLVQDIGKEFIIVSNNRDGDIFIYDRNGKAIRKINRKGQGGEEYTNIYNIVLDESKGEMFVNDITGKKIFVYDLYGKYKRSFKHKEDAVAKSLFYTDMFNYDSDNLICYDEYNEKIAFVLVSKQDGSITHEIKIPFKEKKFLRQSVSDETTKNVYTWTPGPYRQICLFKGNWMLLELSSDTVYTLLPDYGLHPFIVRTPSIQSMNPEVFLLLRLFSDRYYFMETIKNVFNFDTRDGFPSILFMYDKQEKAFFGCTVYNGDYSIKQEVNIIGLRPVNHEVESWQSLEAYQLVEADGKGQLKGKLKEIASKLDAEDNPVIMLVKHRK